MSRVQLDRRSWARRLAGVELWIVLAATLAAHATTRILPAALAVVALFWPLRWLAAGRLTRCTPFDVPFALLLLLIPVTLWVTPLPAVTWPQAGRLLLGLALFYAIVNWADRPSRLRLLADGLAVVALLMILAAPFGVAWFAEVKLLFIPEALYRPLPLLAPDPVHPNVLAGALTLLWPLVAGRALFGRGDGGPQHSRAEWMLLWAVTLAAPVMVLLAKSRGGLMGLAVAAAVLVSLRWRRGWLLLPAAGIIAAALTWWIGLSQVVDALATTQALGGMAGRLEVWSRGLGLARDFAFTGGGMGTFRPLVDALNPFLLAGSYAEVPHAHNLFLQIAVDLGVGGLIAWLAGLWLAVACAWRGLRRGRAAGDRELTGLSVGLLAALAALVTHGLTDAPTWGTRPAVLVWAVWAVACCVGQSFYAASLRQDG